MIRIGLMPRINPQIHNQVSIQGVTPPRSKIMNPISELIQKVVERARAEITDGNQLSHPIIEPIDNYRWLSTQQIGLIIKQSENGLLLQKFATSVLDSSSVYKGIKTAAAEGDTALTKNDILNQLSHPDLPAELEEWRGIKIKDD